MRNGTARPRPTLHESQAPRPTLCRPPATSAAPAPPAPGEPCQPCQPCVSPTSPMQAPPLHSNHKSQPRRDDPCTYWWPVVWSFCRYGIWSQAFYDIDYLEIFFHSLACHSFNSDFWRTEVLNFNVFNGINSISALIVGFSDRTWNPLTSVVIASFFWFVVELSE